MGRSGTVVTFAELDDRSARCAWALRDRGLAVRDHLALMMENMPQALEVAWAAQRSGVHYTAINSHLLPAEVQHVLDDSGATALVISQSMADLVPALDLSRISIRLCADGDVPGFASYEAMLADTSRTLGAQECEGREMLYSSGTTGKPKGVEKALSAAPFGDPTAAPAQIAQVFASRYGVAGDSVYLSPAPLYHSAPLVSSMSAQRLGATVVVMERFDAEHCLELIERYRVTHAQFVPTMFVRLLRLPKEVRDRYDVSSLQAVVHAAAPCPVDVKRQMIEWWGPIIYEYYAGTEDIGATAITSQEWFEHPGSVGRPTEECYVLDENGVEVPTRTPGLVYFRGGRPFAYHNDPGKTASITTASGLRTLGDIGYLDEDGYLYLTDRHAHMIISGGVNIYPREAEDVIIGHPAVSDVAVIGVPDAEMGERVLAVVDPVDGIEATPELADDIVAYCRQRLATYKCPRGVDFGELPRDENGKLYKRLLRDRYWQGHDSRVI
jgi:fatty-acyl-CoA synthase